LGIAIRRRSWCFDLLEAAAAAKEVPLGSKKIVEDRELENFPDHNQIQKQ
jgi:hypothetical protein